MVGNMEKIKGLANEFRDAIKRAKGEGETDELYFFNRFPTGCCGETCHLLAEYLREYRTETEYVCGKYYYGESSYDSRSHAWLRTKDGIIVDITADQFKLMPDSLHCDKRIYIGFENAFYDQFEVDYRRDIIKYEETCLLNDRLVRLYEIIKMYTNLPLDAKIASTCSRRSH